MGRAPARRAGGDLGFVVSMLAAAMLSGILAVLAGSHSPGLVLVAVILVAIGGVILVWPDTAVPLALFLVWTDAPVVAANSHGAPQAVEAIVPLLLAVPLAARCVRGERIFLNRGFLWMTVVLLAEVLATITSGHQGSAVAVMSKFVQEGLIVYLLIINVIRTPAVLRRAVWTLIAAGALLAAVAVVQSISHRYDRPFFGFARLDQSYFLGHEDTARAQGPVADANYFAQVLLPVLALSLVTLWRERSRRLRMLAAGAAVLTLWAIVLTYSRGAAVVLAILIVAMALVGYLRTRHVAAVALAIALLLVIFPSYRNRVSTLSSIGGATAQAGSSNAADLATQGRATENLAALMALRDHPLSGVGPGGFPLVFQQYAQKLGDTVHHASRNTLQGTPAGTAPTRAAHDLFLGIAADQGVVGLIAFLGVLGTTLRGLLLTRRRWRATRPDLEALATGLLLAIIAYVAAGVFLSLAFERYLWILLALGGAACSILLRTDSAFADASGRVATVHEPPRALGRRVRGRSHGPAYPRAIERGQAGGELLAGRRDPWDQLDHAYGWDDLVLPERECRVLLAIPAAVRLRDPAVLPGTHERADGLKRGLTILFAGECGTGKTMAAQILGAELGLPVFRVDLVSVLSQDGVDAEQQVEHLFAAAENHKGILVLDGVAPLFGLRSRATPLGERTAVIEPSHLIERSRRYRGVVIFASTQTRSIDTELAKCFDYAIEFPFPGRTSRREIWRRLLPAAARVDEAILEHLATSFRLAGGTIRSRCLAAAADAAQEGVPVRMVHVARALEQEYRSWVLDEQTRKALEHLRATARLEEEFGLEATGWEAGPRAASAQSRTPRRLRDPQCLPAVSGTRRRLGRPGWLPTVFRPSWRFDTPRWPIRAGRRSAMLALTATMAAAVLGSVVVRLTGGDQSVAALDKHASAGLLRVSVPSSWRPRTPTAAAPLGLTDEFAVAPAASAGGILVIGRTQTDDPSLLPRSMLAALPSVPTAQIVTLGGTRFYRYLHLSPRGTDTFESVYALPTTIGTILGVCVTPIANPGFGIGCERVLGTMRLASGTVLAAGPSSSYASALNQVFTTLNAARSSGGLRLRAARDAKALAKAANNLAAAHAEAASALLRLGAGQASGANSALATALRMTGDAYGALGRATAVNDAGGYRTAGVSLTRATHALNSAFGQLSNLGYSVG